MARTTSVRIEGLSELAKKLQAMGVDMTNVTSRKATGVAAGIVEKAAQQRVPVKTGLLRSQIITKRIPAGQAKSLGATSIHVVTVRQGTKKRKGKQDRGSAPHAHLVEHGTAHSAAQPFLRPALDESVGAAATAMADVVRNRVMNAK